MGEGRESRVGKTMREGKSTSEEVGGGNGRARKTTMSSRARKLSEGKVREAEKLTLRVQQPSTPHNQCVRGCLRRVIVQNSQFRRVISCDEGWNIGAMSRRQWGDEVCKVLAV